MKEGDRIHRDRGTAAAESPTASTSAEGARPGPPPPAASLPTRLAIEQQARAAVRTFDTPEGTYRGLVRGCRLDQAELMRSRMSAGGFAPDANTTRPSLAEARAQTAEMNHNFGTRVAFPEFTEDPVVATAFTRTQGRRTAVVAVLILEKYLTAGSRTEKGWVAKGSAPLAACVVLEPRPYDPRSLED